MMNSVINTVKQPDSLAEKKLIEGIKAGEALVTQLKKLEEANPDFEVETDPTTGQKFLTAKDLKDILEFDKKVREETGHPFIDWVAYRDIAMTLYKTKLAEMKKKD